MGDVGGFHGSLVILLYLIGQYFSSKLFVASITENFYCQKNDSQTGTDKDSKFEGGTKTFQEDEMNESDREKKDKSKIDVKVLASNFKSIKISKFQLLTDPILRTLCCSFSLYNCFFCKSCRKQNMLISKAEKKFEEELNLESHFMKLRDSYDITKNMINADIR